MLFLKKDKTDHSLKLANMCSRIELVKSIDLFSKQAVRRFEHSHAYFTNFIC